MQYDKLQAMISKDLDFRLQDQRRRFGKNGGGLQPATANSMACRCTVVLFSWVRSCLLSETLTGLTTPARFKYSATMKKVVQTIREQTAGTSYTS